MQRVWRAIVLVAVALSFSAAASAQGYECDKAKNWSLSDGQLAQILAKHREWLKQLKLQLDTGDERRARLCNANLSGRILAEANKRLDPNGIVDLRGADLSGANLATAELNGARLVDAELNGAYLVGAKLNGANLNGAKLNGANLRYAKLNCLDPGTGEEKCASLFSAELNGAYLDGAELNRANLAGAKLSGAILVAAELNGANLAGAKLNGADLTEAELQGANLTEIDFRNAKLVKTKLADAWFDGAMIGAAVYEPVLAPDPGYLTNISGITEVTFSKGNSSGLVKLRAALKEAGLGGAEKEATFAIRHNERLMLEIDKLDKRSISGVIESRFELLLFEWTTRWGMEPGRALYILFLVFLFMVPFYTLAIVRGAIQKSESGIFKIEPKGRMLFSEGSPALLEEDRIERIDGTLAAAIKFGAYFSLVSAFQMGWRDLNIGAWLSRLQTSRFSFRARGWARALSGIQSLISVYLLAIWALTYFGHPFQ